MGLHEAVSMKDTTVEGVDGRLMREEHNMYLNICDR